MGTGVLSSTRYVVDNARLVTIDHRALQKAAGEIAQRKAPIPVWNKELHWGGTDPAVANYVLILDALNFSFWADPGQPRWTLDYQGKTNNGYWALAAALRRALEAGVPLTDSSYLAQISDQDVIELFRGHGEIPLLTERAQHLREVGTVLSQQFNGSFIQAIAAAGQSAARLTLLLARHFPSFNDVATYDGHPVYLFKRAQICVGDLYGASGGRDWGNFADLDQLTAFADYKVPQVLRRLGILRYAPDLARRLDERSLLDPGSTAEVEIRAATIWGVEYLRQALAIQGINRPAFELDWYLWELGQTVSGDDKPYHLTRTVYY